MSEMSVYILYCLQVKLEGVVMGSTPRSTRCVELLIIKILFTTQDVILHIRYIKIIFHTKFVIVRHIMTSRKIISNYRLSADRLLSLRNIVDGFI